jgi:ABC-type transport system involved in cytochrome bd biosynthesis fused ATPase/permease subunit
LTGPLPHQATHTIMPLGGRVGERAVQTKSERLSRSEPDVAKLRSPVVFSLVPRRIHLRKIAMRFVATSVVAMVIAMLCVTAVFIHALTVPTVTYSKRNMMPAWETSVTQDFDAGDELAHRWAGSTGSRFMAADAR